MCIYVYIYIYICIYVYPCGHENSPLEIKTMLESSPLKSRILVGRLAVQLVIMCYFVLNYLSI